MPYETHPDWTTPADETVIWRYMGFTKFAAMLMRSELYFASAGKFKDRYEGHIPPISIEQVERANGRPLPQVVRDSIEAANKSRGIRDYVLASCWHMSEHESMAMWSLYLQGSEGVAIQSTIGRLKECLASSDSAIWIGAVSYLPNERFKEYQQNALQAFLRKRRGYQYENEARAICLSPQLRKLTVPIAEAVPENGYGMKIDLEKLMAGVVIAPECPDWFLELVDVALKNAKLTVNFARSDLDAEL